MSISKSKRLNIIKILLTIYLIIPPTKVKPTPSLGNPSPATSESFTKSTGPPNKTAKKPSTPNSWIKPKT